MPAPPRSPLSCQLLELRAKEKEKELRNQSRADFKDWAFAAVTQGGPAAHRWARGSHRWQPDPAVGGTPAEAATHAQLTKKEWCEEVWETHLPVGELPDLGPDEERHPAAHGAGGQTGVRHVQARHGPWAGLGSPAARGVDGR